MASCKHQFVTVNHGMYGEFQECQLCKTCRAIPPRVTNPKDIRIAELEAEVACIQTCRLCIEHKYIANSHEYPCPVCESDRVQELEAQVAELREALLELGADMHAASSRPCYTCQKASSALGVPFGCCKRQEAKAQAKAKEVE